MRHYKATRLKCNRRPGRRYEAIAGASALLTVLSTFLKRFTPYDGQWGPVPLLTQSMTTISTDGKTYLIALRHGVKFHDSSEMISVSKSS